MSYGGELPVPTVLSQVNARLTHCLPSALNTASLRVPTNAFPGRRGTTQTMSILDRFFDFLAAVARPTERESELPRDPLARHSEY
jgi:hypothetical protein